MSDHFTQLSFASSGKLFAHISNGVPYHVFLSADTRKPVKQEELGLTVTGSRFTYILSRPILSCQNGMFKSVRLVIF